MKNELMVLLNEENINEYCEVRCSSDSETIITTNLPINMKVFSIKDNEFYSDSLEDENFKCKLNNEVFKVSKNVLENISLSEIIANCINFTIKKNMVKVLKNITKIQPTETLNEFNDSIIDKVLNMKNNNEYVKPTLFRSKLPNEKYPSELYKSGKYKGINVIEMPTEIISMDDMDCIDSYKMILTSVADFRFIKVYVDQKDIDIVEDEKEADFMCLTIPLGIYFMMSDEYILYNVE